MAATTLALLRTIVAVTLVIIACEPRDALLIESRRLISLNRELDGFFSPTGCVMIITGVCVHGLMTIGVLYIERKY